MDYFESKQFIYLCYEKIVNGIPLSEYLNQIKPENELEYRDIIN